MFWSMFLDKKVSFPLLCHGLKKKRPDLPQSGKPGVFFRIKIYHD